MKELEKKLPELLKKYETILVRENTAEEIIKEKGFNNVKQVLDPTLLLNNEELSSLAVKTKLDGKEYILVYQLHHNKQMEDYLKKLKKCYIKFKNSHQYKGRERGKHYVEI